MALDTIVLKVFMLSVANTCKPIMLTAIMLTAIILRVVMLSVVAPCQDIPYNGKKRFIAPGLSVHLLKRYYSRWINETVCCSFWD
jgi:hypothetical protein